MAWRIPLADIDLGAEEVAAVLEVLASRWLTMGEVTQQFEQEFAEFLGVRHAIAVANGTAALHLACLAAGVGPGDEVILPSLTFVATANAVRYVGATPVFADIGGEDDLNISVDSVLANLSDRTRAILVVHYAGYPCDMPSLLSIARQHGLMVIEDAAHAVGACLQGRRMGVWGDLGCFSFFSNKNMTTGEGGMVVTQDDQLAERVRRLRSHGMTTLTLDRHKGHAYSYDVTDVGYNYRIDEIRAAMGRVQLRKLEQNNARRKYLTELYRQIFAEAELALTLPFSHPQGEPAYHILPSLLPPGIDRQRFMAAMKAQGIQTSIHYPPIHGFQAYRNGEYTYHSLSKTEEIAAREVTLPLYPALQEDHIRMIAQAAATALENLRIE